MEGNIQMQEQFRNLDFYFSEISIFTSGYRQLVVDEAFPT